MKLIGYLLSESKGHSANTLAQGCRFTRVDVELNQVSFTSFAVLEAECSIVFVQELVELVHLLLWKVSASEHSVQLVVVGTPVSTAQLVDNQVQPIQLRKETTSGDRYCADEHVTVLRVGNDPAISHSPSASDSRLDGLACPMTALLSSTCVNPDWFANTSAFLCVWQE